MDYSEKDFGLRDRLAELIGEKDPYPWAESIGIGKSTFAGLWNQGAMPQTRTLLKIAQNTDFSLNWLLTGQGTKRIHGWISVGSETRRTSYRDETSDNFEENERQMGTPIEDMGERYQIPKEEYVLVPRYGLHVGDGQLLRSHQVVDYLSFKVGWIEQTMGLDPRQLALVHVRGDSMEPTLKEGDLLLLDRRGFSLPNRVRSDAIYVLLRGEELVAKRLQCGFDGSVTIQSDNPAYATQVLSAEKSTCIQVVGRVVWVGRRI